MSILKYLDVLWLYGSTFLSLKSTKLPGSSGLFSCFGFWVSFINIYTEALTPAVPARVSHIARLEEPLAGVGVIDKCRRALLAAYQTFQQATPDNR
jgi:hypothetical protein